MADSDAVLDFWLGELDEHGLARPETKARWWKKDAAFDEEIRARFGETYAAIAAGDCDEWLRSARGRLAYVIVLDQFSRNMFRDKGEMFASDALALRACLDGIDNGHHLELGPSERVFLYMPLMHSEDLAVQDKSIEMFTALRDAWEEPIRSEVAGNLKYAHSHRDIIVRFGRYPHRNVLLGRESTAEEREFLTKPGSSF